MYIYIYVYIFEKEKKRNPEKRNPVTCTTQFADDLFWKKVKYFQLMLNIFKLSWVWGNVESWFVYANKLFSIAKPNFTNDILKPS